jgi:hypothetical protein
VLNIDGKSCNNPQTNTNAFNEYFLSLVEKECVDDYDDDDDNGNDDTSYRDNNIYTLIYYLLSAFNNFFPNIKLKCTTMQETESIIKSFKPKNMYGYDEIPLCYLK